MDIGKPQRVYVVEPLEDPVPERKRKKVDVPAAPRPSAPPREPAKI